MYREPRIHFRYVFCVLGAHVHVDVFISRRGRDATHAKAGVLVMRHDEFVELFVALGWSINRGESEVLRYGSDEPIRTRDRLLL